MFVYILNIAIRKFANSQKIACCARQNFTEKKPTLRVSVP